MAEGWTPGSRSWRNNNPGNLRWSKFQKGQRDGFAYFESFAAGWLALWFDLFCKCQGKTSTGLTGESNLFQLFDKWAPASDGNDPTKYALTVAVRLGVSPFEKLKWFIADV